MKTRSALSLLAVLLFTGCSRSSLERPEDRVALRGLSSSIEEAARLIEARAGHLAAATARCYENAEELIAKVDTNQYRFTEEGCYYRAVEDGGPAVWVSGVVPVDDKVQRVVWATEGINAELQAIVKEMPAVAQVYYNDRHSLNRIYPPFDVLSQYEPKMNIPEYNFYYLADGKHNPQRKVVWVDEPYVDPAGRGWMVSCIAPVYEGDALQGVIGLDVTVNEIVDIYLTPADRAWALVDRHGAIVAATEVAIEWLAMPPLTDHRYVNTVKSDRYRTEDYNILQSPNAGVRKLAEDVLQMGRNSSSIENGKEQRRVLAEPVPALGWTALLITP